MTTNLPHTGPAPEDKPIENASTEPAKTVKLPVRKSPLTDSTYPTPDPVEEEAHVIRVPKEDEEGDIKPARTRTKWPW